MSVASLEKRLRKLEADVKKIKEILELAEVINPLGWKDYTDRQKQIIEYLLSKKYEGATTPEIAKALKLPEPEKSGRTIVWRELKRIQRISKRIKGSPIVICQGKRWTMNYEDFTFEEIKVKRGEKEKEKEEEKEHAFS